MSKLTDKIFDVAERKLREGAADPDIAELFRLALEEDRLERFRYSLPYPQQEVLPAAHELAEEPATNGHVEVPITVVTSREAAETMDRILGPDVAEPEPEPEIAPPVRAKNAPTDDREETIRRLNAEGFTDTEIAKRLGISHTNCSRIRRNLGLSVVGNPADRLAKARAKQAEMRRAGKDSPDRSETPQISSPDNEPEPTAQTESKLEDPARMLNEMAAFFGREPCPDYLLPKTLLHITIDLSQGASLAQIMAKYSLPHEKATTYKAQAEVYLRKFNSITNYEQKQAFVAELKKRLGGV